MVRDDPPTPETDQDRDFEEAKRIHEQIRANPDDYPDGWVEQAQFRDRYDLPPFRPPRFDDGCRVRETVTVLEDELDVTIDFVASSPDRTWNVRVDGNVVFQVERSRNNAANTIVEMTADEFTRRIYEAWE